MTKSQEAVRDDEIDLAELFMALRAYAFSIFTVAVAVTVLAAFYAVAIAKPVFEAKSIFAFESASSGGGGGLSDLSGLAVLAGLDIGNTDENSRVFDRVTGRDFIISLAPEAGLYEDPSFNPALSGPGRKARLLLALGLRQPADHTSASIDAAVVSAFLRKVEVGSTENGSIEVIVSHPDANRAAEIANAVVAKVLSDTLEERIEKSRREVAYLGEQLSEVQESADAALSAVQSFAISKNTSSVDEFMRQSAQLVRLRDARQEAADMLDAINELAAADDATAREAVLTRRPALLTAEFRMLTGLSGSVGRVQGLSAEQVSEARSILAERLESFDASIAAVESSAQISAEEAAQLARLQRDVKVEEATYEVLIEQYKARSLSSGFQQAIGDLLQIAVPPLQPASPKVPLIVALGLVLGMILGSTQALVRSLASGRMYTVRALQEAMVVPLVLGPSARIRKLGRGDWRKILSAASLPAKSDLAEISLLMQSAPSNLLVLVSLHRQDAVATGVAAHLARQWDEAGLRTLLIEGAPHRGSNATPRDAESPVEIGPRIDYLRLHSLEQELVAGQLVNRTRELMKSYDRVIFTPGTNLAPAVIARALEALHPLLIAVGAVGKVRRATAKSLAAVTPPRALIVG